MKSPLFKSTKPELQHSTAHFKSPNTKSRALDIGSPKHKNLKENY